MRSYHIRACHKLEHETYQDKLKTTYFDVLLQEALKYGEAYWNKVERAYRCHKLYS